MNHWADWTVSLDEHTDLIVELGLVTYSLTWAEETQLQIPGAASRI